MKDGLNFLKQDHDATKLLFRKYAEEGEYAAKKLLVDQLVFELVVHGTIEEMILYPTVAKYLDEELAERSVKETQQVKEMLIELENMVKQPVEESELDAKVNKLRDFLEQHIKEEEREIFTRLYKKLTQLQIAELQDALEAAKAIAPTHPHKEVSDKPPRIFREGYEAHEKDLQKDMSEEEQNRRLLDQEQQVKP
eukprot:GEZU01043382.1.p1 GENE.GEZU01043382.1~~GEZU01043382.1.p1  ORF type:complete len:195 (-),score=64.01 GEZU01043382.1:65-649(-)